MGLNRFILAAKPKEDEGGRRFLCCSLILEGETGDEKWVFGISLRANSLM